ncbi:MAG: oligosaccharide flippase family protein [Ferruginibacter sp.]|nr:oligosaccharide flippase family protein [Ferruginibacter sp.]
MTETRNRLAGNFISLSVVQGLSILFPLLIFPYLLRVLGVEGFGIFTLIQTFIMYFDLLVSFGFGLTATQQIASKKADPLALNRIITGVYIIKLGLFTASLFVFILASLFIPYARENLMLLMVASLYLLGNLLLPDWFFQGIQKMKILTIAALLSRAVSLILIILLVKEKSDIVFAILAMGIGNILAGSTGLVALFKFHPYQWTFPGKEFLKQQFKESGYVFSSIILAPFYSSVNIFILQFFTNPLIVGYYAVAEKIFTAVSMFTAIVNRTFYPHLSQLWETAFGVYKYTVRKIILGFAGAFLLIVLILFFGAEIILKLVAGSKSAADISQMTTLLRILCFGLLYSPFVSFFFQLMVLQGQKKETIPNIVITVLVNLITSCLAAYYFGATGMAVNLCFIMLLIAFLNFKGFSKGLQQRETVNL